MNACDSTYELRSDDLEHCEYCGSISPAQVLKLLITDGVEYSGCDWTPGYPHKFRFNSPVHGPLKFYTVHFREATADMLELFNRLAENTLGVRFFFGDDGKLKYSAPANYQAHGTIFRPKEF